MDVALAGIFSGVLHTVIIFVFLAAIILVPRYFKMRERERMHQTLRMAYDRGQQLPPELIEALTQDAKPKASWRRDLRTGVIWLGIGVGVAAFGLVIGLDEPDATYPLLGIAAIPTFIGVAFIVIAMLARGKPGD